MNYKQRSKLKGKWAFVRYEGDMAIYAVCQNCGFTQSGVYSHEPGKIFCIKLDTRKVYKYCPNCGLKMGLYNGEKIYYFNLNGELCDE